MISRREKYRDQVVTTYVRDYLKYHLANINIDDLTYLDELYIILAERIAEISQIGNVNFKYIHDWEFVKSSHFTSIIQEIRNISEFCFKVIPNIYIELETASNTILELSEELTLDIDKCKKLMETAESSLMRQVTMSSIKNEIIIYDTIGENFPPLDSTLTVDKRSGSIFLNVINSYEIPFNINSAICNIEKGKIDKPSIGDTTWRNISNGYFHSRTFSASPLFENEELANVDRMQDNNLETSYLVEYNSIGKSTPLKLDININPSETGRVDAIELTIDPSDIDSVLSTSLSLPDIDKISVTDNNSINDDITDIALNNKIKIGKSTVGTIEKRMTHQSPDVYPIINYNINYDNVSNIILHLISENPQEIYYPEEVIKDSSDESVYRFNYFETLIINGYEPPEGYLDPKEYYTIAEKTSILSHRLSNQHLFQDSTHLFRYFIGIKEIKLYRYTYDTTGEAITSNLNNSDKSILGIQLYVNEIIPEGCGIDYYISSDKNKWYQILPDNRSKDEAIPSRLLLFESDDFTKYDKIVDVRTSKVYLKVVMAGTQQKTPILKSYAVRIKTD